MDIVNRLLSWIKNHFLVTLSVLVVTVTLVIFGIVYVVSAPNQTANAAQGAFIMGDYTTSIEEFTTLIDDNPSNPEWYIGRGMVYVTVESFANAQRDFEIALALDPTIEDSRVYRELGYIYAANDNPQQAIEYLTIVIDEDTVARPGDFTARGYAYASLQEPDLDAALADLEFAVSLPNTSTETFVYLADLHYALGNQAAALENYNVYTEQGGELGDVGVARVEELETALGVQSSE